jgi:glycosyltransferase involved in cell wall biosynthesis
MSRLLVLIPDRLSDLVRKGELTERYYNPGNLFAEIHLAMTNDDQPDRQAVQKMAGRARLVLHNLPDSRKAFVPSLGWRPSLLGNWAEKACDLAQSVKPALIRCHGALLNAFAAAKIKEKMGIPYVVSLHINPDEDVRGRAQGVAKRLVTWAQQDVERIALTNADLVMPVYQPIVPYLKRMGVSRYEVCYNSLNPTHLHKKDDYRLHDPVRVISVGRQFEEKNPDNLIRAVMQLQNVRLTLVGDGSRHAHLRQVAQDCNAGDRVEFVASLPNDELCKRLPEFDIFATHSEYWEISKSVLEPLLTGMPVVINRRLGAPVPELTDDICVLVSNSKESYRHALERLIKDDAHRERLGRAAYAHAQKNWSPAVTEEKFASIYRSILNSRRQAHAR